MPDSPRARPPEARRPLTILQMEAMFRTVISLKVAAIAHRHLYQGKTGLSMVARSEAGRRRGGLGPACSGVGRERPGGGEGGAAARGGEWRSDAAGAAAGGRRSPESRGAEPGILGSRCQPARPPGLARPTPLEASRSCSAAPGSCSAQAAPRDGPQINPAPRPSRLTQDRTGRWTLADRRPGTCTAGTRELSVPDFPLSVSLCSCWSPTSLEL